MKLGRRIVVLCGMVIGGLAAAPLSAAQVPPVSDAARAVGFVDVRSVVPDAAQIGEDSSLSDRPLEAAQC